MMNGAFSYLTLPLLLVSALPGNAAAVDGARTTAWRNGKFHVDVAGVVDRSSVVLQRPNLKTSEAMPLGNGRLGAAVWSQDGFTVQLNRGDTFPGRLSPGQVVIPGLKKIAAAPDYAGRLDLYNGEFVEHGAGMTVTTYVEPDADVLVIDVKGADPGIAQTAVLQLWAPRQPAVECRGASCSIEEHWKDSSEAGASGRTFGSIAAISASARGIHAAVTGPLAATLRFKPNPDGSFRLSIAAPEWMTDKPAERALRLLPPAAQVSAGDHRRWWNDFWKSAGLMKMTSPDGAAPYFENLRAIDLYTAAAESRGALPGSQAGIGDLFSSIRDEHKWSPSAYWHWNLRMQVAANLGAGLALLNVPYFNLYRDNLPHIEEWTKAQMGGRPGACVPETMRFNGKGYENETWTQGPGLNCSANSKPYYNARTISTGAEVSLWIWQQYLFTRDRAFLAANYPVMAAAARFLLAYSTEGSDGVLHTYPSNAHENQWDVHDPTTDLSAMRSLFPVVIEGAEILKTGSALAEELRSALKKVRPLPRTDAATRKQQLTSASDAGGSDAIAQSYDQDAKVHNSENIGLEPVWPYSLIGDSGPLHGLGVRTYFHRPVKFDDDWSFDPIQAARLGLGDEVRLSLMKLTEKYQAYPSGLAQFMGPEFYVEQIGVLADALQEALVQDYDGLLRIAPAWPKDWDVDGTVSIQDRGRVHVQMRGGSPVTVGIEAGSDSRMRVRTPWPGREVEVVSGDGKRVAHASASEQVIEFPAESGKAYMIEPADAGKPLAFAPVDGSAAVKPKSLGSRVIGIAR